MTQLTRSEGFAFSRKHNGSQVRSSSPGVLCEGCASYRMARVRRNSHSSRRRQGSITQENQRSARSGGPRGDLQLPSLQQAVSYAEPFIGSTPHYHGVPPPPQLITSGWLQNPSVFTEPRSPESFHSIGSPENSSLGVASADSGSFGVFDRNRTLSPVEYTPAQSIASVDRSTSFDEFTGFQHVPYRGDSIDETLSDRDAHYNVGGGREIEGSDWTSRRYHGPVPLPNMMLPSGLQHVRDLDEPWSTFDNEDMEQQTPQSHARPSIITKKTDVVSPRSRNSPSASLRGGRRQGPLSQSSRQNANDVRKERSCLRCFVYKETCDTSKDVCLNCSNKQARTWKLGCVRPRLMFRTNYLLPDVLASRLERRYVDSFIQHRGWTCRDKPRFAIPLEIGLGPPLNLPVREFLPIGELNRPAYLPEEDGKTAKPIQMFDLPVVISCDKESEAANHIRNSLLKWYNATIDCTHEGEWAWNWFNEKTEPFAGSVMKVICEYFKGSLTQHRVLRDALALSFFNYIFIYSFTIPEDHVNHIRQKMETTIPNDAQYVSPSIINLYVKMLMLPPLRDVVKKTLKGLELLLLDQQNVRVWRRDLIFCVGFIVLAYLGRTQISVIQFANQANSDGGAAILSHEAAQEQVLEMERELADLIIKYHEQFLTPSPRRKSSTMATTQAEHLSEEHAHSFNFMDRIKAIRDECSNTIPADLEPDCSDVGNFIATNTTRICWKFVISLLGGTQQPSRKNTDTEMAF